MRRTCGSAQSSMATPTRRFSPPDKPRSVSEPADIDSAEISGQAARFEFE